VIEGQNRWQIKASQKAETNSEYSHRLNTLHAHYLKALRKDRSLIHLGEKKGMAQVEGHEPALTDVAQQ
jgi:hypothetical protein